jgi:ElaA protein
MKKKEGNILWSIIQFNDLSVQQLFDIMKLRTEIFVVEQDCPYQEVDDKDKESFHVLAYSAENELIAVARIVPAKLSYEEVSFGRVAVKKSYRNNGLAHTLTQKMLDFIKTRLSTNSIRISAQSYLLHFYERLNFKKVSELYFEDGIPHIEMLRLI